MKISCVAIIQTLRGDGTRHELIVSQVILLAERMFGFIEEADIAANVDGKVYSLGESELIIAPTNSAIERRNERRRDPHP